MELDTGAAVSIISEDTRKSQLKLRKSDIVLRTYTNESMHVTGQLHVHVQYVQYGSQTQPLVLVVVAGHGPSLVGRNWLKYGLAPNRKNHNKAVWGSGGPAEEAQPAVQRRARDELGTVQPQKTTLHEGYTAR